jgi:hypothetical protein
MTIAFLPWPTSSYFTESQKSACELQDETLDRFPSDSSAICVSIFASRAQSRGEIVAPVSSFERWISTTNPNEVASDIRDPLAS